MAEWTKEKLEEIYTQVLQKSATDKDFREALLSNANEAIEKLCGEKLPEGYTVKAIEQDPNYSSTFVIPDLISEELSQEEMRNMAGGVSIAAIVSACGAAIGVAGCSADACGGQGCVADDFCGAKACGGKGGVL